MSEDHDIPELTDAENIRVRAMVSDMTEMAAGLRAGTATPEDVAGGVARIMSVDVDRDTMIKTLRMPTDAGPFAPALETILRRIPDGWGRWISHDAGWYPIVVGVDERLSAIDPEYVVHQIKEKFGTLRYYCAPSGDEPDPAVFDPFRAITAEAERASRSLANAAANPACCMKPATWSKHPVLRAPTASAIRLCSKTRRSLKGCLLLASGHWRLDPLVGILIALVLRDWHLAPIARRVQPQPCCLRCRKFNRAKDQFIARQRGGHSRRMRTARLIPMHSYAGDLRLLGSAR
jgi:hypothetical protein